MKRWLPLILLFVTGCGALPEQGTPMQQLGGTLTFQDMTALPPSATAHVVISALDAPEGTKPVAEADFPARTGTSIPFLLKFPAAKIAAGGEYLVLAQVVDHGTVWYSNLSTPLRISFLAEPGDVTIELRREKF